MTVYQKIFVLVLGVNLGSLLLFHFLPLPFFSRLVVTALLIVAGAWGGARYVSRPVEQLLSELRSLQTKEPYNFTGQRIQRFRDVQFDQASARLREILEETGDTIRDLHNERDKFTSILDQFSTGVLSVNEDGHVVYVNSRARELLDIGRKDVTDKLVSEITRVEDVQDSIRTCLDSGEPDQTKGRRVEPDQDLILKIETSPLHSGTDELTGAVASVHDITELQRLRTVRQDFVANVSHELKTPITAIQGYIETLAGEQTMEAETRDRFIRKIRDQTRRMSNMIEDLLTISRLEFEENEYDTRRINMVEPVQEAWKTLEPRAEKKNLSLEAMLPEKPVYVDGHSVAIRQLTSNLLENALKYTPDGGKVTVRIEENDHFGILRVSDTGVGIEPRKQERIFERFYRVDDARTRESGGTGLGLAIVKHLTQALDGNITVDSTPGQGSTFQVKIPSAS